MPSLSVLCIIKLVVLTPKKIVITGGPSTGKTVLISELEKMGYPCLNEISRSVTLAAREEGIEQLFLTDPLLFSKRLLDGRLQQFTEAASYTSEFVFLDRGIHDVIAYMDCVASDYDQPFIDACTAHEYDTVFLLPPWKEIYTSDNERYEDWEEALKINDHLRKTYTKYGYTFIEVPFGTLQERANFILSHLKQQ